jgi:hypothetical protein
MHFHRAGRTNLDAELTGNTLFIIKKYLARLGINHQGLSRADRHAYAAVGAFFLVPDYILA